MVIVCARCAFANPDPDAEHALAAPLGDIRQEARESRQKSVQ
jgi:hypothetical protein